MAACFVSQRVATKSKLMLRAVNVTHTPPSRAFSPLSHNTWQNIYAYFINAFFYFHAKKISLSSNSSGVFFSSGGFLREKHGNVFGAFFIKRIYTYVADAVGLREGCVNQFIQNEQHFEREFLFLEETNFSPRNAFISAPHMK
jgi:hypothetical protein